MKKIVCDIDGTLCSQEEISNYRKAVPRNDMIKKLNDRFNEGYHITLFTARGMNTYSGNIRVIERMLRRPTEEWLRKNGVRYHVLKFGKPSADIYIDDKGIHPDDFVS